MKQEAFEALGQFFNAQKRLNALGIIRSRDYIGDVAKYLCREVYQLKPAKRSESGFDGTIGDSKILVAVNNCPKGTKVKLTPPFRFDELIVVLGPNSKLRPHSNKDNFIFYRFLKHEVESKFSKIADNCFGDKKVFSEEYDNSLTLF